MGMMDDDDLDALRKAAAQGDIYAQRKLKEYRNVLVQEARKPPLAEALLKVNARELPSPEPQPKVRVRFKARKLPPPEQSLPKPNARSLLDTLSQKAKQGDANAQYQMGEMYRLGIEVLQNDKLAIEWCFKSAERGDANAQYLLGEMYRLGIGVSQNDKLSVEWYFRAAMQNRKESLQALRQMAMQGCADALDALHRMVEHHRHLGALAQLRLMARVESQWQEWLGHVSLH